MAVRDPLRPPVPRRRLDLPADAASDPLADLARSLGHDFARPGLLVEALTHPSALNRPRRELSQAPRRSYQRLEFLGDRVLALVIADLLWQRFPDETEGPLTRRLAELVRRDALAKVAAKLDLGRYLTLAPELADGVDNPSILADACEAVIAAVYLDGGFAAAAELVLRLWEPLVQQMAGPPRSPKTRLQEWTQAQGLGFPDYVLVETSGPGHAQRFTIAAKVAGYEPATATASSKQLAQEAAAARLLETLAEAPRQKVRR